MSGEASVDGMKMYSEYKNDEELTHTLLANQMEYSKKEYTIEQWRASTIITLKYPSFELK